MGDKALYGSRRAGPSRRPKHAKGGKVPPPARKHVPAKKTAQKGHKARRRQTPAQRKVALANLAKARAAKEEKKT